MTELSEEGARPDWPYRTPGIPDELFKRVEAIPMTKEEIRALTLSKARLGAGDRVVDVGSGSGSITVEAALLTVPDGVVYCIDHDERAVELTKENARRFGVDDRTRTIHGAAPEALSNLPEVDAIIVGGGSELIAGIVAEAKKKLAENGRIVINAILIETMAKAVEALSANGFGEIETTYAIIAKGMTTRMGTAMLARNPVMIISAVKK